MGRGVAHGVMMFYFILFTIIHADGFIIDPIPLVRINECVSFEQRDVEKLQNVTYICPKPDKCENWWSNTFSDDCTQTKYCVKQMPVIVTANVSFTDCCPGWARGPGGECSIRLCRKPCYQGGVCAIKDGTEFCNCSQGWEGEYCLEPVTVTTTPISPSSTTIFGPPADHCLHGGRAETDGTRIFCVCPPGWTGERCGAAVAGVPSTKDPGIQTSTLPPDVGGSQGDEETGNLVWLWPVVVIAFLALVAIIVILLLYKRRGNTLPFRRHKPQKLPAKVTSEERVELEVVTSMLSSPPPYPPPNNHHHAQVTVSHAANRLSLGDNLYEPIGEGTGTLRGSPRLSPPHGEIVQTPPPLPRENEYSEPDIVHHKPHPLPPAGPPPPNSLTAHPPRSLLTGSIHVYEDPKNLRDNTYSFARDTPRDPLGHYDRANTVSSVCSSSAGSEGRFTLTDDHYDVPKNLDDITEIEDDDHYDRAHEPLPEDRSSRGTLQEKMEFENPESEYDLARRASSDSLGNGPLSPDSMDCEIPAGDSDASSNDHVYNEVDNEARHNYINVNDATSRPETPVTNEVDGYSNRPDMNRSITLTPVVDGYSNKRNMSRSVSAPGLNEYSYAAATPSPDAKPPTRASVHAYADIEEEAVPDDELAQGYSALRSTSLHSIKSLPHQLVLMETTDGADYVGPDDAAPHENLYQSYDNDDPIYTNEDVHSDDLDTSYEDLSGKSPARPKIKNSLSKPTAAPRISILPLNVRKWSGARDSSLYVAPDNVTSPVTEQVYGNVTHDPQLYANQSIDEQEEEMGNSDQESRA